MSPKNYKSILKTAGLILFFILAVWFSYQIKDNDAVQILVQKLGYIGVFVLAFVSGFNVILPIPAMSFLPIFTEAGLHTLAVVAVISFGMTMGDSVGFLLGKFGSEIIERSSWPTWLQKFEAFLNKYKYGLPVFLFLYASFVPLPNELVVIPAAATGQKWWMILVPVFLGNILLNTLIALGITSIT